jgi:hypothetical protein
MSCSGLAQRFEEEANMAGEGQINFRGAQSRAFEGTFNRETGRISDLRLVDVNALEIQGDFNQRDLQRIQGQLRDTAGADTTATRERIAEKTETSRTTETRAPADYTRLGRYSEARTDADLREGFRGDKIKSEQQRLKDQGYLTDEVDPKTGKAKESVDGFWGPRTQAAYERFQADQKTIKKDEPARDTGSTPAGINALRTESGDRTKYQAVTDPKETAKELAQDIRAGNTDDINNVLTNTRNADMQQIDRNLPRDANGNYTTPLADVRGNDSDYADLGNRMLRGQRNEGTDAAANGKVVDEYADKLVRSTWNTGMGWAPGFMNGTNEGLMNDVFSKASGAQLAELDRRIKGDGIRDADGNVFKHADGLRGLVTSEVGEGAHRDLLLAQLRRPLN